jgi:hypothetical protein
MVAPAPHHSTIASCWGTVSLIPVGKKNCVSEILHSTLITAETNCSKSTPGIATATDANPGLVPGIGPGIGLATAPRGRSPGALDPGNDDERGGHPLRRRRKVDARNVGPTTTTKGAGPTVRCC